MMKTITVIDSTATDTEQHLYRFLVWDDLSLVLDDYAIQSRKTKRHGWKTVRMWSRLERRDNTIDRPEPSKYVIAQAIDQVRGMVRYEADRDHIN